MTYEWPLKKDFVGRETELKRLNSWWIASDPQPIALIGRRRVGKSWLFRRFADSKPATILVAEQLPPGAQLLRFAEVLEPLVGVRPDLPDVAALFRVLFRAARAKKILVVVDEFPWLLGSEAQARRILSSVQAVMEEERETSNLKLILCGSNISVMETLFSEGNPMHGRLQHFELRPLPFSEARLLLPDLGPVDAFERFSMTGGMPLYLSRLAKGSVQKAVTREMLSPGAPLWNEGRTLLNQELREPRMYFGILEQLAKGSKEVDEIAAPMRSTSRAISPYLSVLSDLRIASRHMPFGAAGNGRGGHWRMDDNFLRFWFHFVFGYQSELENGLRPDDLFNSEIATGLAQHVSPVFEDWCREWLRAHHGAEDSRIGQWWGNAANNFRRTGERHSEEIDAIGTTRGPVTLVSESKWTTKQLDPSIVTDLDQYKIPALRDGGFRLAKTLRIVLFSKSGYAKSLRDLATTDSRLVLVDVAAELRQ